jgi:hypothetical protein
MHLTVDGSVTDASAVQDLNALIRMDVHPVPITTVVRKRQPANAY